MSFSLEGRPATLAPAPLEATQVAEALHYEKVLGFKPGGAISLSGGLFERFKGLHSKRSKDRVEVLLTLLGHQQRILVPSQQVIAD